MSSFLNGLYFNVVAVWQITTNCLIGRAYIITFIFTLTVFNQQGKNCVSLKTYLQPNPHPTSRGRIITEENGLQFTRDGTRAPRHLAQSPVLSHTEPTKLLQYLGNTLDETDDEEIKAQSRRGKCSEKLLEILLRKDKMLLMNS